MEQYPKFVTFDSYVEKLRWGPEPLFDVTISSSSGKIYKVAKLFAMPSEKVLA